MADFNNSAPERATLPGSWPSVRLAFTTNVALSAVIDGATLQGVLLEMDNRVLLTGQTTPAENGLYLVKAAAAIRATDANEASEFVYGREVLATEGDNPGRYAHTTAGAITLGVTALSFTRSSATAMPNPPFDLPFSNTAPDTVTVP